MGLEITQDRFEEAAFAQFSERLASSLDVLRELLARPRFGEGETTLGAELELSLVDPVGQPLLLNSAVLRQSAAERLTFELTRFNLECNLRYTSLRGHSFSRTVAPMSGAPGTLRVSRSTTGSTRIDPSSRICAAAASNAS